MSSARKACLLVEGVLLPYKPPCFLDGLASAEGFVGEAILRDYIIADKDILEADYG
jgi:hypothetical protein